MQLINKYQILVGYLPPELQNYSVLNSNQINQYPHKIFPITEIYTAMNIPTWERGTVYSSFGNSLGNSHSSIVKWTNYVWICLSNNEQNILNQYNPSTIPPSSTKNEDGYQWILAFEIDRGKKSETWTRIPSFDELEKIIDTDLENFCGNTTEGITGYCLIYKQNDSGITGSLINNGSTYLETTCIDCQNLSKILNTGTGYHTIFSDSTPETNSISLNNRTEKFNSIINDWKYTNNFEIKSATIAKNSGLVEGAILGAFINSSILGFQISTSTSIEVSSDTGSGADVRFTLGNISGNTGEITGIQIINRGNNYSNILSPVITSVGLTAGEISQLESAITLVCSYNEGQSIDGINNLFNLTQQFSDQVKLMNYNLLAHNPEGITFNYYSLITNSINGSLPIQISNIQPIPYSDFNQSESSKVSYSIQFIRSNT
jgi:hypothetical protein